MRGEHILKTWAHDAGAYARCSYCLRYSDDPRALGERAFRCECGETLGWSGSFHRPDSKARWSDVPREPQSHGDAKP